MRVFAAHVSLAKSGELWPLAQASASSASSAQGQARECHRRSRGRAIAPASSSHRRWMAGLALSPAPGCCRPPSAAKRAVGAPLFAQPRARNFVFQLLHENGERVHLGRLVDVCSMLNQK
eukprot:scaffold7170_cov119-Isochrysis_galbana.AAC.1